MKKLMKNPLLTFILGVIISCSITSVLAYSILAPDVGFTPTDNAWKQDDGSDIKNVKEALDDLQEEIEVAEVLGGRHVEKGYVDISFTHSWRYITITFDKPFIEVPTIRYEYNAGTSGGSVYVTNITTTSFDIGYNSFFSNLHSDRINWVAYGK